MSISPHDLSFDDYQRLDEDAQIAHTLRGWTLREDWIEQEFLRRGATWLIVVGDEIVASGADLEAIPADDTIDEMGHRAGKAPLVFTRPL